VHLFCPASIIKKSSFQKIAAAAIADFEFCSRKN
jgi:hypothetical protein